MGNPVDRTLRYLTILLVGGGFFIFTSASLGLLLRGGGLFSNVALNQLLLGVMLGSIAAYAASRIPYRFWRRAAPYLLLLAVGLTALVFVPGVGFEYGGARRWLSVGPLSFQPAELLKFSVLVCIAAWLSKVKDRVGLIRYGMVPIIAVLSVAGGLLLSQPDTDTFAVTVITALAMYFVSGGRFRHIIILLLVVSAVLALIIYSRPYLVDRLYVFLNPASDPLGAGYQLQQSLIAIGSGGLFGRGFGQSLQKFQYLPEPIGDSIFAVFAEEFGFIGSILLILFYLTFSLRGLTIAAHLPDHFGRLLSVGLVILMVSSAFLNIGSMLGLVPLSGLPLPFVSQGGTALFFALLEAGIILNLSRWKQHS